MQIGVTHPSTNRARRRVTLLIETNVLTMARRQTGCVYAGWQEWVFPILFRFPFDVCSVR